jgi:hypothetical protein
LNAELIEKDQSLKREIEKEKLEFENRIAMLEDQVNEQLVQKKL